MPLFDRQYLSPLAIMGRQLVCTSCGTLVDLVEPQGPDPRIDPDTFVGLCCMTPVADGDKPRVNIHANNSAPEIRAPTSEPPAPPRPLALQIRQWHDDTFGSAA